MSNQFWVDGKYYDWHQAKDVLKSNLFHESWQVEALKFIASWVGNQNIFYQTTSGTTGKPKMIQLNRNQMVYSAKTTLDFFNLQLHSHFLLCLHAQYIGAKMMIVRAILNRGTLFITPPKNHIHSFFSDRKVKSSNNKKGHDASRFKVSIDLLSLIPTQFQTLIKHPFNRELKNIRNILIGGAPLRMHYPSCLLKYSSKVFVSYGMSETASHIAIRQLAPDYNPYLPVQFNTVGDVKISTGEKQNLKIKGAVSNNQWVHTTDWVNIISPTSFEWLGRLDYAINSGGIKIAPEQLENRIKKYFILSKYGKTKLAIASLPEDKWGEMPVLVVEKFDDIDENKELYKFCIAVVQKIKLNTSGIEANTGINALKKMVLIEKIQYTENGKINRYCLKKQVIRYLRTTASQKMNEKNQKETTNKVGDVGDEIVPYYGNSQYNDLLEL